MKSTLKHMYIHIHIHIRTRIHIYTDANRQEHAYIHTYIHTYTDANRQEQTQSTNKAGDLDVEASSAFQELLRMRDRAAQASRQVVLCNAFICMHVCT